MTNRDVEELFGDNPIMLVVFKEIGIANLPIELHNAYEKSKYAEIPYKYLNKYINKNNNIEGVSENDLEKETNLIENIENPLLRKD
jgi:hypothetical protein